MVVFKSIKSLKNFIISHNKFVTSFPLFITSWVTSSAPAESQFTIFSAIFIIYFVSGIPTISFILFSSILFSPSCAHLSSIDNASLIAPSDNSAIRFNAPSVYLILLSLQTYFKFSTILSSGIFLKSNLWHLDKIVAGSFWGSVVAKMNFTCFGGSSNVFNKALNAPGDNIWTSSIIYTLYFATVGKKLTSSLIALISSTPLFEAASISTISVREPSNAALQISHSLQGSPSFGCKQLTALARTFADEVFPQPLHPVNKYACPTLFAITWFFNVLVICSWPTIPSNVNGLNLLYKAVYSIFNSLSVYNKL